MNINIIKKYLTKGIALVIITTSIIEFNSIGVSAEWGQDNTGTFYTEGNSNSTGWKNINSNWYYFDNNGYMKTGWVFADGNWYYLYSSGQRATLENIDGYFVNSSGVYINTITASEARKLILKEDGNYITGITDQYTKFSTDYREYSVENMPGRNAWNLPKEPCYEFYIHVYDNNGENSFDLCEYLVGKESKNVYIAPNQGGMSIYQMKNNRKVKTFKYIGGGDSYEWHYNKIKI